MSIDANDPRLTGYALGELEEAERAEVDALLDRSFDARQTLAEIRGAVGILERELADENGAVLGELQNREVETAIVGANHQTAAKVRGLNRKKRRFWIPAGIAAAILLPLGYVTLFERVSAFRVDSNANTIATIRSMGRAHGEYVAGSGTSVTLDVGDIGVVRTDGGDWDAVHLGFPDASETSDAVDSSRLYAWGQTIGPETPQQQIDVGFNGTQEATHGYDAQVLEYLFANQLYLERLKLPSAVGAVNKQAANQPLPLYYASAAVPGDPAFRIYVSSEGAEGDSPLGGVTPNAAVVTGTAAVEQAGSTQEEERARVAANQRSEILERLKIRRQIEEAQRRAKVNTLLAAAAELHKENRLAEAKEVLNEVRLIDPSGDSLVPYVRQGFFGTESYAPLVDNSFEDASREPLSTFSIDVDTGSYANIRRFLTQNRLPPPDAVRIEEMLNYFSYDYPQPAGDAPFSVNVELATCPWTPEHRLMRVGLKGRIIESHKRPSCNLVFLVDVSGSMKPANKLPLLKEALGLMLGEMFDDDRIAVVTYASESALALPSTTANNQETIRHALDQLAAGGSTNGGAGIELAYELATENFIEGGVNRVILATDGDFNVGMTDQSELVQLIRDKAASGVFLSVFGFGMGNLKDSTLEKLADKGNGNYAYIDTLEEAQKVLVDQIGGTLVTIAKDVKIQIEFNPAEVAAYRLIGYANRLLAPQDFNDDAKDAGEIGAGHTVTALYEIVPAGVEINLPGARQAERPGVDPLKYQSETQLSDAAASGELLTVKLRYKEPDGDVSRLIERVVVDSGASFAETSRDFRFAAAVASFGMLLRSSPTIEGWTFDAVLELAAEAVGEDENGYRAEFLGLVEKAKALSPN